MQARIETDNPGEKLKKDMYVTATVQAGKIQNAIAVPDSAVLRDSENQPFVYAEVSANQFGRRSVTLGESLQGQTQITGGLAARRSGDWRRQPVPAVRELAAALNSHLQHMRRRHPSVHGTYLNDPPNRPSGATPAVPGADADRLHHRRRNPVVPAHAGGRLSRPRLRRRSKSSRNGPTTPPRKWNGWSRCRSNSR